MQWVEPVRLLGFVVAYLKNEVSPFVNARRDRMLMIGRHHDMQSVRHVPARSIFDFKGEGVASDNRLALTRTMSCNIAEGSTPPAQR